MWLQEPACKDLVDIIGKARGLSFQTWASKNGKGAARRRASGATEDREGCPMDKGELGAATWGLVSAARHGYWLLSLLNTSYMIV